MILSRSLRVSVLFRKNFLGSRKAVGSENLVLNHFHRLRNLIFFRGKPPSICGVERTFCTWFAAVSDEHPSINNLNDADQTFDLEESIHDDLTTEEIFQEISAGDPEKLKQLKILEFEVMVLREEEARVPDKLSKRSWMDLLEVDSYCGRKKLLSFLRLNELKTQQRIRKAQERRELWLKYRAEKGFYYYGLSGHTMFMRIYDKRLNTLLQTRMLGSSLEIVFDCSYQGYMSKINTNACAKQIAMCYTENRLHRYPCQLKLCNYNRGDKLGQILSRYTIGLFNDPTIEIHEKSYLDLYPKSRLVYLTPHCHTPLKDINLNDVYIIGAFIDKGTGVQASLAKAKEHNLRMAKLPLDEFLIWKKGSKCLAINTVLKILLDMGFYNDWNKALENIPQRNLVD